MRRQSPPGARLQGVDVSEGSSAEEARRWIDNHPTLLSTVTAEQLAAFDAFEGTEFVGRREPRIRGK